LPRAPETGHRGSRLRRRQGRSRLEESPNADLEQLLVELALVLLPRGITAQRLSKLSRDAFIRAAAERSRLRNGRINRSKVAALTGLSRKEIKRVLDLGHLTPTSRLHRLTQTPSERIVQGWLTDRRYLTKQGHPKMLVNGGPTSSFQRLVKQYGGDISPRAVLEELIRSRAARNVGPRILLRATKIQALRVGLEPLTRVIPALIDGLSWSYLPASGG
jgi:hypothetical protein